MEQDKIILAVESSCDETAVAIVKNGKEILANVVSSQINVHQKFGGVIPEVASRLHVENISVVIMEALEQAQLGIAAVDAIAYTQGPGLIGSLHVGVVAAKTLAFAFNKPLLPIHHIAGHIFANRFVDELVFPMLALVVSGGHTELVLLENENSYQIIGSTKDDAVGEAYDKVARVMGLPYPGGPQIDKLAKQGTPAYALPKPMNDASYDFSFSGLKSAVLSFINTKAMKNETYDPADLACSFQEAALDVLVSKTLKATGAFPVKHVVLAGGVAANSRLRAKMQESFASQYPSVKLTIPPLWCCTDNAAMIGAAGYYALKSGKWGTYSDKASPSLDLEA